MSDPRRMRSLRERVEKLLAEAGLPDYRTFSEAPAYRALIGLPERPQTRERRRRLREFALRLPVLPPLLAGPMPELVLDPPAPPAPLPWGLHPDLLIIDDPVRDPAGEVVHQGELVAAGWGAFVVESPLVAEGTAVVARLPEPTAGRESDWLPPLTGRLPPPRPLLSDPRVVFRSLGAW